MKKMMMIMCAILAAGIVSAVPIYYQDFAADPGITAVGDNAGLTPTTYAYETWLGTGLQVWDNGSGTLQISSHSNGGTRGAGFALAASNFSAGDYTISFDITATSASGLLGFGVYEMSYGGTTDYRLDFVEAAGVYTVVRTGATNNIRTTVVADNQVSAVGNYSYDVTLSGTDDLILLFSGMSATGSTQTVNIDNVTVSAIPEPATLGLLGIAGMLVVYARRRMII